MEVKRRSEDKKIKYVQQIGQLWLLGLRIVRG